jgi:predicted Zn-dependent peptidase
MPISNRLLDNGIRLIIEPIATTEAVAIGFWFPSGSREERDGERGLTHFVEHLLFKGTPSLSSRDIARFFDRAGGYANAFTEREMLCLHCTVPAPCAAEALRILASMAFDSTLTDEAIERERTVIVSEILSALDDPEETGMDIALESMFHGHGFSFPIAGTVEGISSFKAPAIRDFYREFLSSASPVVTVAGKIDESEIASFLSSVVVPHRDAVIGAGTARPVWHGGTLVRRSSFEQSQLFVSYPLPVVARAREWHALSMLNAILGETASSRLYQSVREERGLCYSVGSFFSVNRDCAFFTAFAGVPSRNTGEAIEIMIAEIERARSLGFTPSEIEDARMHVAGELSLAAEDSENRMKRLARLWFYNRELPDIAESANVIHSVKEGDLGELLAGMGRERDRSLVVFANGKGSREARRRWK